MSRKKGSLPENASRWDKASVLSEAAKYDTRKAFKKGSAGAYDAARRYGWLSDTSAHMRCGRAKWTHAMCLTEAEKYECRGHFAQRSQAAYLAALSNGWLDSIAKHMTHLRISWTKQACIEEASQFQWYSDFVKYRRGAYEAARKNGWLDEVTAGLVRSGDARYKLVYQLVQTDLKIVYVGITCNLNRRLAGHRQKGRKEIRALLHSPHDVHVTDLMSADAAAQHERRLVSEFRENGWTVLNKARPGSLGGNLRHWTKERVEAEAAKYSTRVQFWENSRSAYNAALANGWHDDVCGRMLHQKKSWGLDECRVEALKYMTRTEFRVGSQVACKIATRQGWMDIICAHMVSGRRGKKKWISKDQATRS